MKQNLMKAQTAALVSYSYRLMISIIFYNSIIILVLLAFPIATLNMILQFKSWMDEEEDCDKLLINLK